MNVVGEDVIGRVGRIGDGDGGVVERFRNGSFRMLPKMLEVGTEKDNEEDSFRICSVGAGSKVAAVSSSSFLSVSSS